MNTRVALTGLTAAIMTAAAIAAGCGGGGGGSALPPPPVASPSPSPSPSATPQLLGTMNIVTGGTYSSPIPAAATSASVDFSCGCSSQAGTATTNGSGNFTLLTSSTPIPASPNPTYTIVPGRNYLVVAQTGGTMTAPEAWTIEFAGKSTATDLGLDDSGTAAATGSIKSSIYTAAAALYVFEYSQGSQSADPSTAFDKWNFNTIETWVGHLKSAPSTHEKTLLTDIISASTNNAALWPDLPTWNTSQPTNATIKTALIAVHSDYPGVDSLIPTPCPSTGCTGTPTP